MLAALTKNPTLILTEDESAKLAAAVNRVTELYDVPLLDERSRAWIGLSLVGVEVYGTRIATAVMDARKRPHVVTPIKPTQPPQRAGAYAYDPPQRAGAYTYDAYSNFQNVEGVVNGNS